MRLSFLGQSVPFSCHDERARRPAFGQRLRRETRAGLGGFLTRLVLAGVGVGVLVGGVGLFGRRRAESPAVVGDVAPAVSGDAAVGAQLFASTCAVCHGGDGRGMPEQGVALRGSAFVARTADGQLVRFLQTGRPATDAASLTRRPMPARGGNARLSDEDLADIVRYLRTDDRLATVQ